MQKALAAGARSTGASPTCVILLEHPPVYTKGRRSTADELPMGEDWYRMQGIEVLDTDRGGRVTYHGPGQLVAYPIICLRELAEPDDVHASFADGVGDDRRRSATGASRRSVIDGLTGVWTLGAPPPAGEARKIGSIGIHVSRGVTTHGLAINVNNDLQPFEWIVPCGIEACRMTSLGARARRRAGPRRVRHDGRRATRRGSTSACSVERSWDEVVGPLALEPA